MRLRLIKDYLSKIFSKSYNWQTLISMGANRERFSFATYEKPPFEVLEKAYRDSSVFASINLLSESVYGYGPEIKIKNDRSRANQLVKEALEVRSFENACLDAIKDTFIFGVSFVEILWDNNRIIGYKIVDPKTIEPKWDEKGNILYYVQTLNDKEIKLEKDEIIFFRFFRSADNVFGVGLIEPILRLLEIRKDVFEAIADIFKFLAMPPVQVIKEGAQTREELKAAEEQLKNFHRKNYFVTNEKYKMNLLEVKRNLPDLHRYIEILNQAISSGLRVPYKLLSGEITYTTKAAAMALREYSRDEISFIRKKLCWILEEQLVVPICQRNGIPINEAPEIVWKSDVSEDPKVRSEVLLNKAKLLGTLIDLDLITQEEAKGKANKLLERF